MARNKKQPTVAIEFIREAKPKDGSGDVFAVGEVHEMSEASAEHWIRRGYAVPHVEADVEESDESSIDSDSGEQTPEE